MAKLLSTALLALPTTLRADGGRQSIRGCQPTDANGERLRCGRLSERPMDALREARDLEVVTTQVSDLPDATR